MLSSEGTSELEFNAFVCGGVLYDRTISAISAAGLDSLGASRYRTGFLLDCNRLHSSQASEEEPSLLTRTKRCHGRWAARQASVMTANVATLAASTCVASAPAYATCDRKGPWCERLQALLCARICHRAERRSCNFHSSISHHHSKALALHAPRRCTPDQHTCTAAVWSPQLDAPFLPLHAPFLPLHAPAPCALQSAWPASGSSDCPVWPNR